MTSHTCTPLGPKVGQEQTSLARLTCQMCQTVGTVSSFSASASGSLHMLFPLPGHLPLGLCICCSLWTPTQGPVGSGLLN